MSCKLISPSAQIAHHENTDLWLSFKYSVFKSDCVFYSRHLSWLWFGLGLFVFVFVFVILVTLKIARNYK